jgi:FtsZ-binding cell division protein ZapB
MVTIEQVELLESKVSKAIDYVRRLTAENEQLRKTSDRLVSENDMLYGKLDGYQKRIAELEVVLQGFKRDQERIEQGIISALERLNHFEDAVGDTTAGDEISAGTSGAETEGDGSAYSEPSTEESSFVSAAPPESASAETPAESAVSEPVSSTSLAEESGGFAGEPDKTDEESVSEPSGSFESSEPEATNEDAYSNTELSDEMFDEVEMSAENGIDEDNGFGEDGEDSGDEFLDALKNDSSSGSGLGQTTAGFDENAGQPSENTAEKSDGGFELDIY